MRDLRKGAVKCLGANIVSWKCERCDRILLSKAEYVNQPSYAVSPSRPGDTVYMICGKVCKSAAGLKRHMLVHREQVTQQDLINPMKTVEFICHLCVTPCKSAAGLKNHLRGH